MGALQNWLTEAAERLKVPGVAAGIFHDGTEEYAVHGVTSIENPLPVDEHTLFQFGSTGKTYTATAIMRLVEQGRLSLEDRVRRHVPELKLKDEDVAESVTVLNLLNHTSGWQGDLLTGTGDGDDALARYVELMAGLEQEFPLGGGPSYNNAALSLAGRVIEKVTGLTFEQAIRDLVLTPLGFEHHFFFPNEIMTHRFSAGHQQNEDTDTIKIVRPWAMPRSSSPAGGMASCVREQIAWARFHLGDGTADDGSRVLSKETIDLMKEPTILNPLGEGYGISWAYHPYGGARLIEHGGDTIGQHSAFSMFPDGRFAVTVLTNCGPNGSILNEDLVKWAYEHYVDLVDTTPEPVDVPAERLREYTGTYETIAMKFTITAEPPRLRAAGELKPETLAQLKAEGMDAPEAPPPFELGILDGDGDLFIVSDESAYQGLKGYFVRDDAGTINGLNLSRLATKTS